jgi:hypothetical protein
MLETMMLSGMKLPKMLLVMKLLLLETKN